MKEHPFKVGDRVRMNAKGLKILMQSNRTSRRDWPTRQGLVTGNTRHQEAYVIWDRNKSIAITPHAILERCDDSLEAKT